MQILVLNGPNLNLLGQRETAIYGTLTLGEIESLLRRGAERHVRLEFFQSNHEGQLIDRLQQAARTCQGVVFNPAGYAHTSVALRDTIAAIGIPVIEIHISNIYAREDFRSKSLTGAVCAGVITGFGPMGYQVAIDALERIISRLEARGELRKPEERRPEERRPDERREERREGPPRDAAPREERRDDDSDDDRDSADGKRRRRGRRGGRGRKRGAEGDESPRPEGEASESRETRERPAVDIEAKYANLKGATVRRGLDVLAEDNETGEAPRPRGQVTFSDTGSDEGRSVEATIIRPASRMIDEDEPPVRKVRTTGMRRPESVDSSDSGSARVAPSASPKEAPAPAAEPGEDPVAALGIDVEEDTGKPRKRGRKPGTKTAAKKSAAKAPVRKRGAKKAADDSEGE